MKDDYITDALGKPVEIGKIYAYVKNSSGIVKITIGRVIDIYSIGNGPQVKMKVLERRSGHHFTGQKAIVRPISYIKACALIQIPDYEISN